MDFVLPQKVVAKVTEQISDNTRKLGIQMIIHEIQYKSYLLKTSYVLSRILGIEDTYKVNDIK